MYLRILLLLALIAGFEPAFVSADEPDRSQFNMMVDKADFIFRGTVIAKEYHEVDTGDIIFPFAFHTFEIHDEFKGESPDGTLIVRTPGGPSHAASGIVMVSGTTAFSLGGEYLLFLEAFDFGTFVLSGGKFRIELGHKSGNPVLLTISGRQVLDFDENGPILGDKQIAAFDQPESDLGIYIHQDGLPLGVVRNPGEEAVVRSRLLFDDLRQYIANRELESTYKPGKKVNHAPTGNWVIDALER